MLHRGEVLHIYTSGDFKVLKMGNEGVSKVIGIGDVCLHTNMGMQLLLKGVKHTPDIVRFNLISVQMLNDGGYDNHFGSKKGNSTKVVVVRGEKFFKLCRTKTLIAKDNVNVNDMMETSLWHQRLNHVSAKGTNCLAKKDVVPGFKGAKSEKYSHCMTGKQTRVSFKKHPPSRKSKLLELVHSDICGSLKVKSFGDALYFVTFVDNYSRKLWIYALNTKRICAGEVQTVSGFG